MQETPRANRLHIAVFGQRNAGKSSLINTLTNQQVALVSEVPGTTTDPVYKNMELKPLGPVVFIDTAGLDDQGQLGELRKKKTGQVLQKTDMALLVIAADHEVSSADLKLINKFKEKDITYLVVLNKVDQTNQVDQLKEKITKQTGTQPLTVSTSQNTGIEKLRDEITNQAPAGFEKATILGDLIKPEDVIILVVPLDTGAPKGRIILPQVQTIRDILDHHGITLISRETELTTTLKKLKLKPKLVVTDSQVFKQVSEIIPRDIMLTSFSVLFARYKGDLTIYLQGIKALQNLNSTSKVLIAEACTHRRQKDDIGTVKLPHWIKEKYGTNIKFDQVSGGEYPDNLQYYDLILHCGGCMLNRREIINRLQTAVNSEVPVVNYGMAIAALHDILDRALQPFTEITDFENIEVS